MKKGDANLVRYLALEMKANTQIKDGHGNLPIDYAEGEISDILTQARLREDSEVRAFGNLECD